MREVKADRRILTVANHYLQDRGMQQHPKIDGYRKINESRLIRIADAYEAMAHNPASCALGYLAFREELLGQYSALLDAGFEFTPWGTPGQPYLESETMIRDARSGHLYFFVGADLQADNWMLSDSLKTAYGRDLSVNDVFRCVHDIFGHALYGFGFGPRGEENAYRVHSAMFSEMARQALVVETRGQSAWVNFGRHVRGRNVPLPDRPYAEQKNGILPEYCLDVD